MSSAPRPYAPFERLSSTQLYHSRWCGLRRDMIRLPGGREQDYHVFEVDDAIVVVPLLPNGDVLLVWQYRYVHGRTHWEVPAGRIHVGEAPELAAHRELGEEVGHSTQRLERLPGFYPINGISPHYAHAFVAHDCELLPGGTAHEDSEQIEVHARPRAEVERMLRDGEIADGFSALALFYAFQRAPPR
ncbi:MAG: NUDIX hydrolase [Planctomycetota bacterium]|nr:MAG: NUDIX hydrolase [Planctomycetota bacterium]